MVPTTMIRSRSDAALLAFKPGGDEVDVNSIDNIHPAQWALLELLVCDRDLAIRCFGSAIESSSLS